MLRNQYIQKRNRERRQSNRQITRAKVYEASYQAKKGLAPRGFRPYTARSIEKKVFDMGDAQASVGDNYTSNNVSSAGTVVPIFIPRLGSDFNQRIGRKVVAKSLYVKWRGFPNWTEEPEEYTAQDYYPQTGQRILIVSDSQPNGVLPAATDILQPESDGSLSVLSFVNMNNRDRFKILMDKWHQFAAFKVTTAEDSIWQSALGASTVWTGKKFKRCNLEVIFNASSGGTIGDISTGALYLIVMGTEPIPEGGSNKKLTTISVNTRIRYSDN